MLVAPSLRALSVVPVATARRLARRPSRARSPADRSRPNRPRRSARGARLPARPARADRVVAVGDRRRRADAARRPAGRSRSSTPASTSSTPSSSAGPTPSDPEPQEPAPVRRRARHGRRARSSAPRRRRRPRRHLSRRPCSARGTPPRARARSFRRRRDRARAHGRRSRRARASINLSLGSDERGARDRAGDLRGVRKGSLVVAAAGNDGDEGSPLGYPASIPHVLTVGATDRTNAVASFSSTLALRRPRRHPASTSRSRRRAARAGRRQSGTSFAAPLVSGASRLGLDGAARARQHAALRGDAPLGRRHRRARAGRRERASACSTSRRRSPTPRRSAIRSSRTTTSSSSSPTAGSMTRRSRPAHDPAPAGRRPLHGAARPGRGPARRLPRLAASRRAHHRDR